MSGILIIAEYLNGNAARISKEIVGAATALKGDIEGPVRVVVMSDGNDALLIEMNLEGVDEIIAINTGSSHFDSLVYE